jgi:hypothetical protein
MSDDETLLGRYQALAREPPTVEVDRRILAAARRRRIDRRTYATAALAASVLIVLVAALSLSRPRLVREAVAYDPTIGLAEGRSDETGADSVEVAGLVEGRAAAQLSDPRAGGGVPP